LQYSCAEYYLHGIRLSSQEICNEYAAKTMFCQSQAYPTEHFFISKKCQKIWHQKKQIGNAATQELRMRIKYARKLSIFCYVYQSRKLSLPFPLLRHYEMPECFYVNNCGFWARVTVLSCYRIW